MDNIDTREWLITNGLGSFASGTVSDAHTRTYHGWMIATLNPPTQRTLLLARIDASLDDRRQRYDLGTNYWGSGDINPSGYRLLQSFQRYPTPTWTWGGDGWCLTRQLIMPYAWCHRDDAGNAAPGVPDPDAAGVVVGRQRLMVHYQYEGQTSAVLTLRPLIADRGFHYQQFASDDLQFSQIVGDRQIRLQALRLQQAGTPWMLQWTEGVYYPEGVWYWDYRYPEETRRGLGDREDLYSPGYIVVTLNPGDSLTLEASLDEGSPPPLTAHSFGDALAAEQTRLSQCCHGQRRYGQASDDAASLDATALNHLLQAGDQFLVYRHSASSPTILAGYPWFDDWGRDTLIALPGLTLTTGRFSLARGLLRTFARYCEYGLIPNAFPDSGGHPFYNSLDASLWWIETLGLYLDATQDWDFLIEQYVTVQRIYKALTIGTLHSIRVDAVDGLLTWDAPRVALTWMDAAVDDQPVTPRRGKPIEVNALWYSSLCWAQSWAQWLQANTAMAGVDRQARRYQQQAEQVRRSLQTFWNPKRNYFYDVIDPDDRPDERIRPNAIVALSLSHAGFDPQQGRTALLTARDRLLTPYGLRSLDPADPQYVGRYSGNVMYRDRVYHQGTVWTWLLGPFIRAWRRYLPDDPLPLDLDPLLDHLHQDVCIGSISELFNGDPPHNPQGAIAQAWSVAEIIRHWLDLKGTGK